MHSCSVFGFGGQHLGSVVEAGTGSKGSEDGVKCKGPGASRGPMPAWRPNCSLCVLA